MKKVFLLFAAMSLCMSAFSQIYIIKDGKLQNGVTCGKDDWKDGKELVSASTLKETGDGYLTITPAGNSLGCRLELDPSIFNLHLQGLNIVFEYELPHSAMLYSEELGAQENVSAEQKDKPTFNILCGSETGSDFKFKFDAGVQSIHICRHCVDGKFNPDAEKGFVKYESYSFPKSNEKVNTVYITYMRELKDEVISNVEPAKIKNLYFYAPDNFQTFFGESFDNTDIWQEVPSFMKSDTTADNPKVLSLFAPSLEGCFQEGNHYYTVYNYDEIGKRTGKRLSFALYGMMMYENGPENWTGSDGSGFLSSQLFHGMVVRNNNDEDWNVVAGNVYVGLENVELPEKYEGDQLQISCITKAIYKSYSDFQAGGELPIYYKFDNQTEESKLYPESTLNEIYTLNTNIVKIPSGAKSISFFFKASDAAAYVVDNLEVAANWTTSVADVNGESKTLSIYPNPVQDQIAFSGIDNVETVEVVSLNGAVASFPVVNGVVNVAKLAAGEYVIVVNKTISGKFIKK